MTERSQWRWLGMVSALSGLMVLLALATGRQASLGATLPASTMCVGGLVLFIRLSVSAEEWERIVHGPSARRFLAVGLAISALLGLATVVVMFGLALRQP